MVYAPDNTSDADSAGPPFLSPYVFRQPEKESIYFLSQLIIVHRTFNQRMSAFCSKFAKGSHLCNRTLRQHHYLLSFRNEFAKHDPFCFYTFCRNTTPLSQ